MSGADFLILAAATVLWMAGVTILIRAGHAAAEIEADCAGATPEERAAAADLARFLWRAGVGLCLCGTAAAAVLLATVIA